MQLNREFFLNLVFLIAVNGLIKPFYLFGIERVVQNTVPPSDYGIYFVLFNLAFLLQIVNDLGIQYFNNQSIAKHGHLARKYFPNMLLLKGVLGCIFLLGVGLVAMMAGYQAAYFPLLFVIAGNQILNSLVLFLRSNISGLGKYRFDSFISVIDKLLLILILGTLLWTPTLRPYFRIEWFAWAQTISLGLTALVCWLFLRGFLGSLSFSFRPALLLIILRQSYPYALAVFLMTAYTRIDGVMIERLLPNGADEAAIYASAYRLLDASNMIGFLFAGLLLPMFARLMRDTTALQSLVQFSFQLIWAFALTLASAVWFYRTPIMELLYHTGGAYSGQVLGYLMIGFTTICGSYVFGTLIAADGRMKAMNYVYTISLVMNILLNAWWIPTQKATGAALATLVTQAFVFGAQIVISQRQHQLQWRVRPIIAILAFTILTLLLAIGIHRWMTPDWCVKFILTILAGGLSALLFRLVQLRALLQWLRPTR